MCLFGLPRASPPCLLHEQGPSAPGPWSIRSVLTTSCLFLWPRPWQFDIRDSTDKQATYLLLGFETLNLNFCDLKL